MSIGAMMVMAEARRRRDSRGRYMEGGEGAEMNVQPGQERRNEMNDGASNRYYPGGMPPPFGMENTMRQGGGGNRNAYSGMDMQEGGQGNEMRGEGGNRSAYSEMEMRRDGNQRGGRGGNRGGNRGGQGRRSEGNEGARMGGYGGFVWDRMDGAEMNDDDDDDDDDQRRMQRPGYPWGGEEGMQGNITSMQDYAQKHGQGSKRMIGFGQDQEQKKDKKKHLTKEDAEEWVAQMKTKDGKPGKRWSFEEVRQYAGNYGVTGEQKVIDFFVVLNMLYSDYSHVAKKLGVDRMDFYAEMAKAFLNDPDAEEGKLARYKEYIAKDEE